MLYWICSTSLKIFYNVSKIESNMRNPVKWKSSPNTKIIKKCSPPSRLFWCFCYKYTRSLAHVDFSGGVFTFAHFQKIAHMLSLCDFVYISEGFPSLMHFFMKIFCSPKKTQEPRIGCMKKIWKMLSVKIDFFVCNNIYWVT